MNKRLSGSILLTFFSCLLFGQGPYYNSVDLTLEGLALKNELSAHIVSTHSNFLSYSEVWDVLKSSDLNPENAANVLLIYGYNDTDGNIINDRSRDKDDNGGSVGDWNREHVYPKSLGTPNLGTAGPGSDPHHLRSSDVQMNGNRSNLRFNAGSGNAGSSGSGWYPGDEWKGDCARMMMYMYLRYGNQCYPDNVANGSTNAIDNHMIDLFLDWNAADPVSEYELVRNEVVEDAQGNRNPFIDNPALATKIWGGTPADDPWGILVGIEETESDQESFIVFPNPCIDNLSIQKSDNLIIETVDIYNLYGVKVKSFSYQPLLDISSLVEGFYFLDINQSSFSEMKPFVVLRD